jgi:quercetin dioxygenase-like cupin family protein
VLFFHKGAVMKKQNYREVKAIAAAPGVKMHIVAGTDEGAPTFVMRVFEIEPGRNTPHHTHPWEHEMFVIEGDGILKSDDKNIPIKAGDTMMVLPNEKHGVFNTGKDILTMICVVPLVDGKMPGMPATE